MIALITPTGARLNQFNLCAKWMKHQTYPGIVLWVIIDDANPVTTNLVTETFRNKWIIEKIYPKPSWQGQNTQARNIKSGIDFIKKNYQDGSIDTIFIIEDDDYYKPEYLQSMMNQFNDFSLLGETHTIYYNVQWRMYVVNNNMHHASLFQTAFRWDAIPVFESCFSHKFIDAAFWKISKNKHLIVGAPLSVGIKGMPGRGGIGAGHQASMYMSKDIELRYLIKIIGEDAKLYTGYYRYHSQPQRPLFVTKRR